MSQSELYKRGFEQLKAGNYEEARRLFKENEDKAGTTAATLGLVQKAEAQLAAGDVKSAAALYEQVLDRNPSIPETYLGLARLALFTNDLESAKVHATAATRLAPKTGLAWTLLGMVHESQGDTAGALQHLRKGSELSPNTFLCQFNYGRALAAAGQPKEGIMPLMAATGLEPKNPDGFYTLGIAYKEAKQYENALRAFEKAKDLAPKNLDTWATLADVLFEVKEFKAARDILDRALATCGDHPALLEKALAAAMMLNDPEGGAAYVERELKVVPKHEQGWLNLAGLYLLTKDYDKSEQAAKTLLEKNPKNWEAWFHLGNLYEASPELEGKAEDAYRKAIELGPKEWRPLMNLGVLFVESTNAKKHAEAVSLLEKAQALAPKDEWRIPYNLALAYTRLGKKDQALALAQKIQREAPAEHVMAVEARRLESNLREGK